LRKGENKKLWNCHDLVDQDKNWSLVRRSHLRAKTRAKDGASGEWVRSSLPEFQMEIPDNIRTKEGPIKPVGSASGAKERVRTVSSLNHPNKRKSGARWGPRYGTRTYFPLYPALRLRTA